MNKLVTIIIPSYRSKRLILSHLNKLSKQDYPWNFGPKKSSFIKVKKVIDKFKNHKIVKKILIRKKLVEKVST